MNIKKLKDFNMLETFLAFLIVSVGVLGIVFLNPILCGVTFVCLIILGLQVIEDCE